MAGSFHNILFWYRLYYFWVQSWQACANFYSWRWRDTSTDSGIHFGEVDVALGFKVTARHEAGIVPYVQFLITLFSAPIGAEAETATPDTDGLIKFYVNGVQQPVLGSDGKTTISLPVGVTQAVKFDLHPAPGIGYNQSSEYFLTWVYSQTFGASFVKMTNLEGKISPGNVLLTFLSGRQYPWNTVGRAHMS